MDLEFAIKVHKAISPKHITALLLKSSKASTAKRKSALLMHTSCEGPSMIYYGHLRITILLLMMDGTVLIAFFFFLIIAKTKSDSS